MASTSRACKEHRSGPLGLHGVPLLAADTTGDSGICTGSKCGGEWPRCGNGRIAMIDLVAHGSGNGDPSHHSVTPVGLKQSAIEKVSMLTPKWLQTPYGYGESPNANFFVSLPLSIWGLPKWLWGLCFWSSI